MRSTNGFEKKVNVAYRFELMLRTFLQTLIRNAMGVVPVYFRNCLQR